MIHIISIAYILASTLLAMVACLRCAAKRAVKTSPGIWVARFICRSSYQALCSSMSW